MLLPLFLPCSYLRTCDSRTLSSPHFAGMLRPFFAGASHIMLCLTTALPLRSPPHLPSLHPVLALFASSPAVLSPHLAGMLRPSLLSFFADASDFTRRLTSVCANAKFSHPGAGPGEVAAALQGNAPGLGSTVAAIKKQ